MSRQSIFHGKAFKGLLFRKVLEEAEEKCQWTKNNFPVISNKKSSYPDNIEEVTITSGVTSTIEDISKAELALVEEEIQKPCSDPQK